MIAMVRPSAFQDETERDVGSLMAPDAYRLVLVVSTPDADDRIVPIASGEQLVIGRGADCRIRIDAPSVSKLHAALTVSDDSLTLTDNGSRNGTRVKGSLIKGPTLLGIGDEVRIGPATITVVAIGRRPERADKFESSERLVVADPAMRNVFTLARRVGAMPTSVLVIGETGAGKEVVVEAIHRASPRATKPLVCVNCAALVDSLLEAELFGHEKGAFTGADRAKTGLLEAAGDGTLFLDEVGELSLLAQAKLLRVLESRSFLRVGSTTPLPFHARVVAATNRDLEATAKTGAFREDLYYRLAAFVLRIPPLRERKDEIAVFARLFLREFASRIQEQPPQLSPVALERLREYPFPGNVRELRNAMEHAFVLATGGVVETAHLPPSIQSSARPDGHHNLLEASERKSIEEALAATRGNHTHTAERLGISRRTLLHKMAKYRLGKYASRA